MNSKKPGNWNAGRVLAALGRIGYHPVSAILDLVDNSVSADAGKVVVKVNRTRESRQGPGRRKAVTSSFVIIDDGVGMDKEGLENAITLGSSESYYPDGTLSKFGMGMKSAGLSLGKSLELVSRTRGGEPRKFRLDLEEIEREDGGYFYFSESPSKKDIEELNEVAGEGSGTAVRISKVNHESLPRVGDIISGLKDRIGVVFKYYIAGEVPNRRSLEITVDDVVIDGVDPLFRSEASGNLDETDWDGLSVKWIIKDQDIQLDLNGPATARLDITQLPHPPSVQNEGVMTRKSAREKYLIASGNYGIYIYRNYRLISWADSLSIISQSKELYAFRGSLMIRSDADDLLNIDVTKSKVHLSELAHDQIHSEIREAVKKSIAAWKHRTRTLKRISDSDARSEVNANLDKAAQSAERDDRLDEEVAPKRERRNLKKRRESATKRKQASKEEVLKLKDQGERVQFVPVLQGNQLWERAREAELGLIAKVNQSHRLVSEVIDQCDNPDLIKLFFLMIFALVQGEYKMVYKSDTESEVVEAIMESFRERVGSELAELMREMDIDSLFAGDQ